MSADAILGSRQIERLVASSAAIGDHTPSRAILPRGVLHPDHQRRRRRLSRAPAAGARDPQLGAGARRRARARAQLDRQGHLALGRAARERVERDGIEIYAVDGFPADCTNLAVHSLFDGPPELVVSGVNVGLNVGLGFFLSSGTVGAAMEGWIAACPPLPCRSGSHDRALETGRVGRPRHPLWTRAARVGADVVRSCANAAIPRASMCSPSTIRSRPTSTRHARSRARRRRLRPAVPPQSDGVYVHDFTGGLRDAAACRHRHRGGAQRSGLDHPSAARTHGPIVDHCPHATRASREID